NGVDLVLCGHSHVHERSYLLHGHYGLSDTLTESMKINPGDGRTDGSGPYHKNDLGQGVVYSVSGSSGQYGSGSLDHPAHYVSINELGSLIVDVNGKRLDAMFLNSSGVSSDHFTLIKEPLPAVPVNLVARMLDANTVALSWIDLATNELGYTLERSTDGVNFTRFATNAVDSTNAVDVDLLADTTYFYRVRGFNIGGDSSPSGVASVTTVGALAPPAAPSRLLVNGGEGAPSRSPMVLHWRDHSANEAGFLIERAAGAGLFLPLATVGANVTFYVDRDLALGVSYLYRVRSFNAAGESDPADQDDGQSNPHDTVVLLGGSASFHAGVQGTPEVGYRWRFMDTLIAGATNETLTITNAQMSDQGPYTVAVIDGAGETVSDPAWLFVLSQPVIGQQPA